MRPLHNLVLVSVRVLEGKNTDRNQPFPFASVAAEFQATVAIFLISNITVQLNISLYNTKQLALSPVIRLPFQ